MHYSISTFGDGFLLKSEINDDEAVFIRFSERRPYLQGERETLALIDVFRTILKQEGLPTIEASLVRPQPREEALSYEGGSIVYE